MDLAGQELRPYRWKDAERTHKTCRTCQKVKPIDEFWMQRARSQRRQSECKGCMRLRNAAWTRENKDVVRSKNNAVITRRRQSDTARFLLSMAKYRAKRSGLDFDLTADDLVIPEVCPVLGIPIVSRAGANPTMQEKDSSPSIDRIDSSKGYTKNNVIVVSFRANRLKNNASIQELKQIAKFYEQFDGPDSTS